jgi:hypothetical protein
MVYPCGGPDAGRLPAGELFALRKSHERAVRWEGARYQQTIRRRTRNLHLGRNIWSVEIPATVTLREGLAANGREQASSPPLSNENGCQETVDTSCSGRLGIWTNAYPPPACARQRFLLRVSLFPCFCPPFISSCVQSVHFLPLQSERRLPTVCHNPCIV